MNDPRSGLALVLVLIVVAILSVVIAQFTYSMQIDERIAQNFAMDRKNYYAARGGVILAKVLLEKDGEEDGARDTLDDDWAGNLPLEGGKIGDVSTDITITDQERLININRLNNRKNNDFVRIHLALSRLLEILELDISGEYAILERITDYIDNNEEGDFEDGAKNGPLTTIEEMLQIPGIQRWMIYGWTDEMGEQRKGLADFVGLWGIARVNLNTASKEVLRAISTEITEEDANNIVAYRDEEEPFNTPLDLTKVTGMADIYKRDNKLIQYVTTLSTYFEVRIRAEKDNVKKDVRAILRRQGKKVNMLFWKEREL
jgi:general secretion pathway protein K